MGRSRKARIVIGLNSGTSADAVDAVACEIKGRGLAMKIRVLGHVSRRYPPTLRHRILQIMAPAETTTEEICRLDVLIGRTFAAAARAVKRKTGLKRIDLVGSHGQTVCHLPPTAKRGAAEFGTLQLGEPSVIACELDVPVVSHFRQADVAVGGQGAPLVPWTDIALFRRPGVGRVLQNLGGIANLTWIPPGASPEDVIAFDTGPGNMLIDALVAHFTKGRRSFDRNGVLARRGTVRRDVLRGMLAHPFFLQIPPRSCGREQFGLSCMKSLLKQFARKKYPAEDWIATATAFTANTIASAYSLFLRRTDGRYPPMDEVILCGGGARNKALVDDLKGAVTFDGHFRGVRFSTTADYGISIQEKESVSFAMLAAACIDRVPANLPRVTGAARAVVLGQVSAP